MIQWKKCMDKDLSQEFKVRSVSQKSVNAKWRINKKKGQNHRCSFTDFISRGYEGSISANSWLYIT